MSIVFNCQCGQQLASDPMTAGQQVQCPHCNSILVVPHTIQPPAPRPISTQPVEPPLQNQQLPSPNNPYGESAQLQPSPNPVPPPKTGPQSDSIPHVAMQHPVKPNSGFVSPVPTARPPGTGKRPVNGMGMVAGIAGIVFAVLHLGCDGLVGIIASFVGDVQSMSQAPSHMTGSSEFNGTVNNYFGYVKMGLGLTIFLLVAYSAALVVGAVGLFRGRLWGWIVSNITAAIAVLIAILMFVAYMKTLSGLNAVDRTVEHVADQTQISEQHTEFARDANDMQREQVHWTSWFVIAFYVGYAALVGICLLNPATFRDYKS